MGPDKNIDIATDDVKDSKVAKKEKKKEARKLKKRDKEKGAIDTEEKEGGKAAIFFVTLGIVLVWLGILALLIKLDMGGFGSTVLKPILKDVPYLNMILPTSPEEVQVEEEEYPYNTLASAIEQIKALELQIQTLQEEKTAESGNALELQTEVDRLKQFETEQIAFEEIKKKFYEEVVFTENAPDIEEYKVFYESIDPTNAEILYKQVVKQTETDAIINEYAGTYAGMKPKQAAAILETMTTELDLVAKILKNMDVNARGSILGAMNAEVAAKITKIMEP